MFTDVLHFSAKGLICLFFRTFPVSCRHRRPFPRPSALACALSGVGWLCLVTAAAVKPGLSYHSCGTELEEGGSSPGPEIGSGAGSRSAARGVAERWRSG